MALPVLAVEGAVSASGMGAGSAGAAALGPIGWAAIGGMAILSIGSSIMGARAAKKAADRKRAAEIQGAQMDYAAKESSINIMKSVNRETSGNLIQEALRAGGAQNQQVRDEITRATSTLMAQSEGLTSGRSKGRQMIEMQIKGNKALQNSKSQTTSVINTITDQMDAKTNDLNNKLINAYQNMATVLTTPGAVYQQNPLEIVQAGIGGASQGASLFNAFK